MELPIEREIQLGQGEGPIGIMGPISQPRGIVDAASLMLGLLTLRAFSEPTLLWAAKGGLLLHGLEG